MRVYLITKDKKLIIKEVDNRKKFFDWNEGSYRLDGSCVRLTMKNGGINPKAMIIFIEGNPISINSTVKEKSMDLLDEEIYRTDLESVAHVDRGLGILNWFKNINTEKVVLYIVLGLMAIYAIYLYSKGELI